MTKFLKYYVYILGFAIHTTHAQINITLDYSNAALTYEILKNKDSKLIDSLLKLPTTLKLIKKANRYNKAIDESSFKEELENALTNSFTNNDHLRFERVVNKLNDIQSIYNYISNNEAELVAYLNEFLGKYLNKTEQLDIKAYLLLGGTSDGFSSGKSFSLDIGFFDDDIEGVKLLLAHEMFHIVQGKVNKKGRAIEDKLTGKDLDQYYLVKTLFKEGTASFIANPLEIKEPKSYIKWFSKKYSKNLRRTKDNFELFQSIYFRLLYDKDITYSELYNIGFSGFYDSPFYFVGFRMCELIKKHEGDEFLSNYLRESPLKFLLAYDNYSKKENKPNDYPILSPIIIDALKKLNNKE